MDDFSFRLNERNDEALDNSQSCLLQQKDQAAVAVSLSESESESESEESDESSSEDPDLERNEVASKRRNCEELKDTVSKTITKNIKSEKSLMDEIGRMESSGSDGVLDKKTTPADVLVVDDNSLNILALQGQL